MCQDENTSNFVESFNSLLRVDRCKPVMTLLEGIRRVAIERHAKRQQLAEEWDEDGICPKIESYLKAVRSASRTCRVLNAGRGEFEIKDGQSFLSVSLNNNTSECGK